MRPDLILASANISPAIGGVKFPKAEHFERAFQVEGEFCAGAILYRDDFSLRSKASELQRG